MTDEVCGKLYRIILRPGQIWFPCQHDKGHTGACGYEDRTPY